MLKSRLTWHCHFIQKLESEPELEFKELHPITIKLEKDNYFLQSWSQGENRFSLHRCLYEILKF